MCVGVQHFLELQIIVKLCVCFFSSFCFSWSSSNLVFLCVFFSVLLLTWWWRIVEVLPLQKAVQETQRLILQVWTPVPTSIPCETLRLFVSLLPLVSFVPLQILFVFVFVFLRVFWWWRIVEVLPLQKAVQETQRLILQVWTPVPTSIPQDKAIKRNQGCLLVIAFVGVRHHKRFLEPLNTLR